MLKFHLPYVILPPEFLALLKTNIPAAAAMPPIIEELKANRALMLVLEKSFKDLDDGRGFEKTIGALSWHNFRDRLAGLYVFKALFGDYPNKTGMDFVSDIKHTEARFSDHSVHGSSRLFLLGFYLRLANIQIRNREKNKYLELRISHEMEGFLKLSQVKSEKIDWLILILAHLQLSFGEGFLASSIMSGKKIDELYEKMPVEDRKRMLDNLLAYGASIGEQDPFIYDRI